MLKAGVLGTVGALVAVAITFFIGDAVSGPLMVTPPGGDVAEEVLVGAALFSTVLGSVIGIGLAALCKRFVGKPIPVFLGICLVGLIVFAIFPFTAGENVATGVWLNVMHIVAAIPVVGMLVKALQAPDTP